MSKTSKSKNDSRRNGAKESHKGSAKIHRNHASEDNTVTMNGLALIELEVIKSHSTDEEEELLTGFYDLKEIEGLPRPCELIKWLLEDKVLVDCGEMLGEIPMISYVEEGLFVCFETTVETDYGPSPYIGLSVTPKGIEWLKEYYGPTSERFLSGLVPN